jgi:FkbM family methyltransferase
LESRQREYPGGRKGEGFSEGCAGVKELGLATLQWYVRHFPISKGKGRLVSWLWKPLSGGKWQRQTVLRQADVQVVCDLSRLIQRHLYFWGGYEEEICAHWLRLARESRIVFDVGANVGLYSLLAGSVNPQSKVYAFEPTLELTAILQRNIELNGMQNISVEPVAVGDSERMGFLRLCAGSDGSNEGMNYLSTDKKGESDLPVAVVSLDSYCQSHNIEQIDLIKMDIEGGEYEALLGARQLLQRQAIGCIFLEMAEWAAQRSGHSTYAIKRLLVDAGYRLFRLGSHGPVPMAMETAARPENAIAFSGRPRDREARKGSGAMEAGSWQLP